MFILNNTSTIWNNKTTVTHLYCGRCCVRACVKLCFVKGVTGFVWQTVCQIQMITTRTHKIYNKRNNKNTTRDKQNSKRTFVANKNFEIYKFKRLNHKPTSTGGAISFQLLILRQQLLHSDYERLRCSRITHCTNLPNKQKDNNSSARKRLKRNTIDGDLLKEWAWA